MTQSKTHHGLQGPSKPANVKAPCGHHVEQCGRYTFVCAECNKLWCWAGTDQKVGRVRPLILVSDATNADGAFLDTSGNEIPDEIINALYSDDV